jgi:hypothetical protein
MTGKKGQVAPASGVAPPIGAMAPKTLALLDAAARERDKTQLLRPPHGRQANSSSATTRGPSDTIGGRGPLQWATAIDTPTQQSHTIPVDAILVNIGFSSSLGLIREWGLELDANAIRVSSTMHFSRPGIFAAGDPIPESSS